jgi:oligoendopeptidase F
MSDRLPPRSAVPPEATADVSAVFATPAAWEAESAAAAFALENLGRFRGRLGDGPGVLAAYLEASEDALRRIGRLQVYAEMRHSADTTDPQETARTDRARALYARAEAAVAFADPEIAALGRIRLEAWRAAEPRLAHRRHQFDRLLRRAEHRRSPEVEELLAALGDPFGSAAEIHGTLADADLTFRLARGGDGREAEVASGTIDRLLRDPDPELRRTAWESYADGFLSLRHGLAAAMATGVRQRCYLARARHYGSALEAALAENDIPVGVFHRLLEVFRAHLPVWHRYWRLLRRTRGGRLRPCDIHAPLAPDSPHLPLAAAVEIIAEAVRPLGREYAEALRQGAGPGRWVDSAPNRGKRAGAFSTGTPGTPPFILMSHTADVASCSTLAHELGHSMHTWLCSRTQPYVYADYSIFAAEVASNFNQALVRDYLLRLHPEPAFQLAVLEEAMSNYHRYLFLMPTLARFEREIHEREERGEPLTADAMDALLADLFAEGYGGEVEMDGPRVGNTWAQFPTHLYANFYVYQYATGISGAEALASAVLAEAREGGPAPGPAATRYLDFLRAGSSLYPLDALRRAGVDLSGPGPVEAGFRALERTVERLEELLPPAPAR